MNISKNHCEEKINRMHTLLPTYRIRDETIIIERSLNWKQMHLLIQVLLHSIILNTSTWYIIDNREWCIKIDIYCSLDCWMANLFVGHISDQFVALLDFQSHWSARCMAIHLIDTWWCFLIHVQCHIEISLQLSILFNVRVIIIDVLLFSFRERSLSRCQYMQFLIIIIWKI